jgi:hypothetical protein
MASDKTMKKTLHQEGEIVAFVLGDDKMLRKKTRDPF